MIWFQKNEREKSLNYVLKSKNVDCMTIGMESIEQVDDNIDRIMRITNEHFKKKTPEKEFSGDIFLIGKIKKYGSSTYIF